MGSKFITYRPSSTGLAFHNAVELVRGWRGCVGNGKSSGCCWDIWYKACSQYPSPYDNVRRTKVLVIRNTFPQLVKTTIQTWLAWFPQTKMHNTAPLSGVWRGEHPSGDGTTVEITLEFYALDSEEAARGLKSYEVTMVWVNEACFLPWRYIAKAYERVGRYPKADDLPNGQKFRYKSFGLIMDTNPPSDTSWWYKLAEVKRPKGFKFFSSPPALIKRESEGKIWYEPNKGQVPGIPAAENIENHNEGWQYYLKQVEDGDHARIKVEILGEYGTTINGDPVYPQYNDNVHFAGKDLDVNWGIPIYLGTDFGRTPCSVICQYSPSGQLRVIDEICTVNCDASEFSKNILRPKLMNEYRMHEIPIYNFGDPAGNDKGQTEDRSCIQIMREAGINTVASPVPGNSFTLRQVSVAERLRSTVDGGPGLIVSDKCKMIRAGFQGRYYYRKITAADAGDERVALEPEKNAFSHPHDALQYVSYGLSSPSCSSLFSGFTFSRGNNGSPYGYRDQRVFNTKLDMGGFY